MQGSHCFKYAALSLHTLPIWGLHDFIIPAFSLQKSHIYLSRKLKNVAFPSHKSSHFPRCHGIVMKWRNYATWTSSKSCIFVSSHIFFARSRIFCKFPQFHCINMPHIFIALFKKTCRLIKDSWDWHTRVQSPHVTLPTLTHTCTHVCL